MTLKTNEPVNYFCHKCDIKKKLPFKSDESYEFMREHFHCGRFSMYSDEYGKNIGLSPAES